MANKDRVRGFVVHKADPKFIRRYFIPATDSVAVAQGDIVKLAGSADTKGVATVAQSDAGDTPIGVVLSVELTSGITPDKHYRPASTAAYVLVQTDPNAELLVQEDGVGTPLAATSVGLNADLIDAGVDTTAGTSGMELDSSTAATTSTLVFNILGFAQRSDNVIGANAKMLVTYNVHQLKGVGIAGV